MTFEIKRKVLKKGFAKVIDEEKSIFTIGNVKLGKKSKWMMKYIKLMKDANGISSLMIYDSQTDADNYLPKKIVVVDAKTEAKQIQPIDGENFCLIVHNNSKESAIMACNFYGELIDWQSYINDEVKNIKLAQSKSKAVKLPPLPSIPRPAERENREESRYMSHKSEHVHSERREVSNMYDTENNDIYGGTDIYTVEVVENETANKLQLQGNYSLQLFDDGFQLLDKESETTIFSWPVSVLRRYGSSNNRFSFETGRRSESGVGNFVFLTPFCKLINQAVFEMTKRVKESISMTDLQRVDSQELGKTEAHERIQKLDSRENITNSPDLRYEDPHRRYYPSFEAKSCSIEHKANAKSHSTSLSEPISETGHHLSHQSSYNRAPSPLSPQSNLYYKQQGELAGRMFSEPVPTSVAHQDILVRGTLETPQELHTGRGSPFISPNPSPNLPFDANSDDEEENKGQPIIKPVEVNRNTIDFDLNLENSTETRQDYINVSKPSPEVKFIDPSLHHISPERLVPGQNYENSNLQNNRWRSESDPKHSIPFYPNDIHLSHNIPQPTEGPYVNVVPEQSNPTESVLQNEPQMPRYSNQQLMQQQLLGAPFPQQRPFFQPQFTSVPEYQTDTQYGGYNIQQSMSSLGISETSHRLPQTKTSQELQQPQQAFNAMGHPGESINRENQRQYLGMQQTASFPHNSLSYPMPQQEQYIYPQAQQEQYIYPQAQQMVQNPYNFYSDTSQLPPHSQAPPTSYGYPMSGPSLMANPLPQNQPPGVFPKSAPSTLTHSKPEYRRPDQ